MRNINQQLLNDLDAVFKSILVTNHRDGRVMCRREICEQISKLPAPRLYITPEYALRVSRNYSRCGAYKTSAYKMHQEVRRRYNSLPENMRTLANLSKVISEPAESFYLTPARISTLLYRVYDRRK